MFRQISHEIEVNVPATHAWQLYIMLQLAELVKEELPHVVEKVEPIEGDGGEGTVFKLAFATGITSATSYTEKFTKIDNEKLIKEAEVIEGGYLDLGFNLYRVRFEVIEKGKELCIIKSTIEYDVKEEAAANVSLVTMEPFSITAEVARNYHIKNKTKDGY